MNPPKAGMDHIKTDHRFPKNGGNPGPLVGMAVALEEQARLKEYRNLFCKEPHKGYILQHPNGEWKFRGKPVSDPLIRAHVNGKYWVGVPGGWRTKFAVVDFDHPTEAKISETIRRLKLDKGQYLLFTSPSWWDTKNCHLYFPVEYKGHFPTCKLSLAAIGNVVDPKLEIYPQPKKPFRLPLGKNQWPLDDGGFPQGWMGWQAGLDELLALEPLALETLPFARELPFTPKTIDPDAGSHLTRHSECVELWKAGLQAKGERHGALKKLALWFYRRNWPLEGAVAELVEWQRKKSNGFSELVNRQDWKKLRSETERVVNWYYEHAPLWPDNLHNLEGAVAASDVIQGAQLFPGDVVNQKRWCSLIEYYRPRRRHGWVYFGAEQRRDGCNWDNVRSFHETLESKGVAEFRRIHRHVPGHPELSFSQMVKVNLARFHDVPLEDDERNVVDYYAAVRQICPSVNDAVSLTGVCKVRFYEAMKRKTTDNVNKIN